MTINAINGLSELAGSPAGKLRSRIENSERPDIQDSVEISSETEATQLASKPAASEIRLEQVEAAKVRIQSGSYKVAEVVLEVASRIASYM